MLSLVGHLHHNAVFILHRLFLCCQLCPITVLCVCTLSRLFQYPLLSCPLFFLSCLRQSDEDPSDPSSSPPLSPSTTPLPLSEEEEDEEEEDEERENPRFAKPKTVLPPSLPPSRPKWQVCPGCCSSLIWFGREMVKKV